MNKYLYVLLLFPFIAFSQVTNEGKPLSWKIEAENIQKVTLPAFDLKKIQEEDAENEDKGVGPWRFGYEHQVDIDIDSDGNWTNLPDGSRFWLINIFSANAKTMNFVFDKFYIPEGGKLYFYNSDKSDLLGAYTHTQNREDKIFGSWLVDGDDIFIEYFEPADKIGQGRLHLSKAVHGYRSVTDFSNNTKDLNDSGPCNLDVDCSVGADFDDFKDELKKSVGMIVVGTGFCTGALINNTNNDGAPYFLTADHCLSGGVSSWAFRFNWRSPSPQCATGGGSTDGSFNQTVSGAILLANNSNSDFALLEITAPLPSSWDLVWAGWDRTSTPANYTVGIHHPSGDIMKVCRDDDPPFTSFQLGAQVWYVNEWETGVTEGGSSGSPLFNQDGRIIGQLLGGGAACSGTVNNGQPDWYGRFDVSWNSGSSSSTRLRDWLDPNNTGETEIDQYPTQQVFNTDAKLVVNNVPTEICNEDLQPVFEVQNNGSQPLTSVNLTYQLNSNSPVSVSWTGNISNGETALLDSPTLALNDGPNILTATLDSPNGVPDESVNNNSVTKNVTKTLSYETTTVNLTLNTDNYGNETTWEFLDENGTVIDQGGPYNDNITVNESITVNPDLCYSFTIFDSYGDGICCGFGTGSYTLTTEDGSMIFDGAGDFGSQEITNMSITDNLSISSFTTKDINIYPNPSSNFINVESNLDNLAYEIFDINGKLVMKTSDETINLSGLSNAVYFLKITNSSNQTVTKKIIKQ